MIESRGFRDLSQRFIRDARSKCIQLLTFAAAIFSAGGAFAQTSTSAPSAAFTLIGIPIDFILFASTLLGVSVFHRHTFGVALCGLAAITMYKLLFTGFARGTGLPGLGLRLAHEWVILANLLGLLLGFALLFKHFEESRIPALLPNYLPDGWKGGFILLVMIFVLSCFLDNIAAASNASGSGSVVGDTTTTMMWINGVSPLDVFEAYIAAGVAIVVFGIPAALQQHRYSPIAKDAAPGIRSDWARLGVVALILAAAIAANVVINTRYKRLSDSFPFIGAAVWIAILITAPLRRPDWSLLPGAFKGIVFLLSDPACVDDAGRKIAGCFVANRARIRLCIRRG